VIQKPSSTVVSARSVDDLVKAMAASRVSKSQMSCLVAEIDKRVNALLTRPSRTGGPNRGSMPPTSKHARAGGSVSMAATIAVGVNTEPATLPGALDAPSAGPSGAHAAACRDRHD